MKPEYCKCPTCGGAWDIKDATKAKAEEVIKGIGMTSAFFVMTYAMMVMIIIILIVQILTDSKDAFGIVLIVICYAMSWWITVKNRQFYKLLPNGYKINKVTLFGTVHYTNPDDNKP